MLCKPHILSLFLNTFINSIKHKHSCKILNVDPDKLASEKQADLDLHCFQEQDVS